jgi:soluble lytic murein transglycosylase-like protein
MSIRSLDYVPQPATGGATTVVDRLAGSSGTTSFDAVLASVDEGVGGRTDAQAQAVARAELLRLRMMRDAISLQSSPLDSGQLTTTFFSENLLRSLGAYQEHSGPAALPQQNNPDVPMAIADAGTVSESVVSATAPQAKLSLNASLETIIDRAARRYSVAPELIKAVIKTESNFNARAESPAGARGLMQLMPGTARGLGVTDSFDPEQNVMAGTRYLRQMLDKYDGNLDSALAAYNWGPGNLDRKGWSLPRETRNYLARVKNLITEYTS